MLRMIQRREIGVGFTASYKAGIRTHYPYIRRYSPLRESQMIKTIPINPIDFYKYPRVNIDRVGEVIYVIHAELQRRNIKLCDGDCVTLSLCNPEYCAAYRSIHSHSIEDFFRYHWNLFYDKSREMFIAITNKMIPNEFRLSENISPWNWGLSIRRYYYYPIDLDFFVNVICDKDRIGLTQKMNNYPDRLDFYITYEYHKLPTTPSLYIHFDSLRVYGNREKLVTDKELLSIYNRNIIGFTRQINYYRLFPFLRMHYSTAIDMEFGTIEFASRDRLVSQKREEDGISWKEYPNISFDVD